MKRNPWFAVAVLLFLLLALMGSWVYLNDYGWPSSNENGGAAQDSRDGGPAVDVAQDPFVDVNGAPPEVGSAGERRPGGPLETPTIPRLEPERPTTPRETAPKPDTEPAKPANTEAKPKSEIIAELVPGAAGISGIDGDADDLDPFIVSTLSAASLRTTLFKAEGFGTKTTFTTALVPKSRIDTSMGVVPEIENVLVGRLIWPSLPKEQLAALKEADRRQAVVFLEKLPELRAVVDSDEGWFFLEITDTLVTAFKKKGLSIVVHSPAFQINGGFESVDVKESDGAIQIQLDVTPVIEVVVDVTPAEAVESGVRVWLERWGGAMGMPDYDDSLYMSAKVPSSGRLIFTVPEHYGVFLVAATGEAWHSGQSQCLDLEKWKTTRVDVRMTLTPERCDLVTGDVVRPSSNKPVAGASLHCTHFGTAVYTDPRGAFRMYVPWDRAQQSRTFYVSADGYRPEWVPLESGGTGSPGVKGGGPGGPLTIELAAAVEIDITLPKGAAKGVLLVNTSAETSPERGKVEGVTIWWGTRFLYIRNAKDELQTLYIDPSQWTELGGEYWAGGETKPVEPQLFVEAFKKR